jgi:serine/threonine protein kinase
MLDTEQATRYREIRRLGAGGMAMVTLAEDTVLGRPVALERVYGAGDPRGISRSRLRIRRAETLADSGSGTATVALETASVQTDRMEQCSGTAQTVRIGAGGWVVDGVAINCP